MTAFATPRATAYAAQPKPFRIGNRIPNEFYPTPPEATRALLSVEQFDGPIWEPACGNGQIAQVLADHGHAVVSTDLYAYGFGASGIDFLRERTPRARNIVTNPPYGRGLADRFLNHALELCAETGGKVAMLLNLASLCHPSRTAQWRERPPARIYAIDDIVCWPSNHALPKSPFLKHRYCWAVWIQDHDGPPALWWLSSAEFRVPAQRPFSNTFNDRRFS
jgi:predicted RNA methylase